MKVLQIVLAAGHKIDLETTHPYASDVQFSSTVRGYNVRDYNQRNKHWCYAHKIGVFDMGYGWMQPIKCSNQEHIVLNLS